MSQVRPAAGADIESGGDQPLPVPLDQAHMKLQGREGEGLSDLALGEPPVPA